MKQITTILALLIAGAAWSSTAFAEVRIATIQSQRLIKESPQYKKMEAQMKADFERRAKELEQDGKSLSEDLQEFKRNADVMSAAERARTEKDLNAGSTSTTPSASSAKTLPPASRSWPRS